MAYFIEKLKMTNRDKKDWQKYQIFFLLELVGAGSVPGLLIQGATLHLKMEILH